MNPKGIQIIQPRVDRSGLPWGRQSNAVINSERVESRTGLALNHAPELAFFPGMNVQSAKKIKIFEDAMKMLKNNFELLPMGEFAKRFTEERKVIRLNKKTQLA